MFENWTEKSQRGVGMCQGPPLAVLEINAETWDLGYWGGGGLQHIQG